MKIRSPSSKCRAKCQLFLLAPRIRDGTLADSGCDVITCHSSMRYQKTLPFQTFSCLSQCCSNFIIYLYKQHQREFYCDRKRRFHDATVMLYNTHNTLIIVITCNTLMIFKFAEFVEQGFELGVLSLTNYRVFCFCITPTLTSALPLPACIRVLLSHVLSTHHCMLLYPL